MNMDDTISKINSLKTIPDELFKRMSESARWVIPLECIPDTKKVWFTIEEAKELQRYIRHLHILTNDHRVENLTLKCDKMLKERIEQAEKCHG